MVHRLSPDVTRRVNDFLVLPAVLVRVRAEDGMVVVVDSMRHTQYASLFAAVHCGVGSLCVRVAVRNRASTAARASASGARCIGLLHDGWGHEASGAVAAAVLAGGGARARTVRVEPAGAGFDPHHYVDLSWRSLPALPAATALCIAVPMTLRSGLALCERLPNMDHLELGTTWCATRVDPYQHRRATERVRSVAVRVGTPYQMPLSQWIVRPHNRMERYALHMVADDRLTNTLRLLLWDARSTVLMRLDALTIALHTENDAPWDAVRWASACRAATIAIADATRGRAWLAVATVAPANGLARDAAVALARAAGPPVPPQALRSVPVRVVFRLSADVAWDSAAPVAGWTVTPRAEDKGQ